MTQTLLLEDRKPKKKKIHFVKLIKGILIRTLCLATIKFLIKSSLSSPGWPQTADLAASGSNASLSGYMPYFRNHKISRSTVLPGPSKEDYRVSMKKPLALAHSRSSEKNSWCGGGCWRSKAWWGKLSQIFLATQWLARIMHSATVS